MVHFLIQSLSICSSTRSIVMVSKRSNLICSLTQGHHDLEMRQGFEVYDGIIRRGSFPKFGDCKYFIFI